MRASTEYAAECRAPDNGVMTLKMIVGDAAGC